MKIHTLEQTLCLPISRAEAWEFFSDPKNLDEITPDDVGFSILNISGDRMHPGQVISYRIKVPPGIPVTWVTEITHVDEGHSFVDDQRFGPYKLWHHRHSFEDIEGGVKMTDLVHYALPFSPFGEIGHGIFVKPKLDSIFAAREKALVERFGKLENSE